MLSQSVADNATMTIAQAGSGRSASSRRIAVRRRPTRAIHALGIVTEGPEQLVSRRCPGGNQQKVVMARALASTPSVLVLMDPTAGIDVKSKEALLGTRSSSKCAQDGKAILVVSGELEDLRTCDRVLIMRHGAIVSGASGRDGRDNALVASIEGI